MFDRSIHNICIVDDLTQSASGNQLVENLFTYGRSGLDNTRKMSVKCLLILSVEMIFIFIFDGFADGQINKIS